MGNPDKLWVNRYNVQLAEGGHSAHDLDILIQDIAYAERGVHLDAVRFHSAHAATWSPEPPGSATAPVSFITHALNYTGDREVESDRLPLQYGWLAPWSADVGRPSYRFYRGCLVEGDVWAKESLTPEWTDAGTIWVATAAASLEGAIYTALEQNDLGGSLFVATKADVAGGFVYRTLTGLGVGRPAFRQTRNKYYDR